MARVNLSVNGRSYEVACADGQEEQLERLGADLDRRISELVSRLGQVGEARLLLLGALLIANEAEALRNGVSGAEDGATLELLQSAAQRVDTLAARLEEA